MSLKVISIQQALLIICVYDIRDIPEIDVMQVCKCCSFSRQSMAIFSLYTLFQHYFYGEKMRSFHDHVSICYASVDYTQ